MGVGSYEVPKGLGEVTEPFAKAQSHQVKSEAFPSDLKSGTKSGGPVRGARLEDPD